MQVGQEHAQARAWGNVSKTQATNMATASSFENISHKFLHSRKRSVLSSIISSSQNQYKNNNDDNNKSADWIWICRQESVLHGLCSGPAVAFPFVLKKTPWCESANELYRPRDQLLSAKWLPTFCGLMVTRGQRDGSLRPYSRFPRQESLLFYQVAPQLYSRGWADPVPDPLLFFW
jgi:hypothetical protein